MTLFYFSQVHDLPLDVSKLKLGSQQQFQQPAVKSISVKEVVTYVLGTLLNQGYHFLKRMNICSIDTAYVIYSFCIRFFILMNVYTGGRFSINGSNTFKIRFVTGTWCLVTLVLVNVYNGILISYVTSNPREKPLVESPDDLLANANIHLVVEKGQGADFIFSVSKMSCCCQMTFVS